MSTLAPTRPTAPRVIDTPPRGPSPWPVTTTIDPFRVLRRHILWIIGAAAAGVVLGVVAYFLLARFFPLYSGRVLFEIRPGLSDPGQIGTQDISQDELVRQYNRAQLLVCPSLYEGFGLPAAEAMACGTPVVATTAGALPEIVDDGVTGALVPPGDAGALAQAIRALLSEPERGARVAARARSEGGP